LLLLSIFINHHQISLNCKTLRGTYSVLVGARDGRRQSARACLFFFPSLQTHPPKNLKIWSLIPSSSFFQKINPGQPAGKGRKIIYIYNPDINPGQPAGKGRKKKKKKPPWY
jgi:hypothetical protein